MKNHCNMLQTKTFISCDICIFCRATKLLTYLLIWYVARYHFDACDIPFLLTTSWCIVVTSKLWSITFWTWLWCQNYYTSFFEHGWETVFYHTYTVKVYYKYIYILYIYIYITTKTQVLITLSKAMEQFCWKSHLILWKSDTRKSNV